jgi:thiosulfate/3-mercaptopyruvate sulfurtransferase
MLKMVRGRPAAAIVSEPMRVYKTEVQNDRPITVNDNPYLIGTAELQSLLHDRELRIVDCRFELLRPEAGRAGYLEAHIPGAVYADLDRDLAGPIGTNTGRHPLPDVASAVSTFSSLGIDQSTRVVVYDDASGAVAARAWWLLRWLGHDRVALLNGGFAEWVAQRLPIESGQVDTEPRKFEPAPRVELVIGTEEILAAVNSETDLRLVDARDRTRFLGEAEPIDAVAGHIPGARNLPYPANLDDSGLWKSPERLADGLAKVLGETPDTPWAVMCGSGVTACHLVLAGLLAGYREPRVYVGSWSEWITDPVRKIATGPD